MSQAQFQKYLADNGRAAARPVSITPACWPHTEPMRRAAPTTPPPPDGDVSDESLDRAIAHYEGEACRYAARAADLRAIRAKRMAGAL